MAREFRPNIIFWLAIAAVIDLVLIAAVVYWWVN